MFLVASSVVAAPRYHITNLAESGLSAAHALNNRGQILGRDSSPAGAVVVVDGSVVRRVGGFMLSEGDFPAALSETGMVVGDRGRGGNGWLWDGSSVADIGLLSGDQRSCATWVDAADRVYGVSLWGTYVGDMDVRSRVRTVRFADGTLTELKWPGFDAVTVTGGNRGGMLVGSCPVRTHPSEAFVVENGQARSLGTLGGESSGASDVNDSGVIVGYADASTGGTKGFAASAGRMVPLNPLTGYTRAKASAVNNWGVVVGTCDPKTYRSTGFVWSAGVMRDINELADAAAAGFDSIVDLVDINDSGQILAGANLGNSRYPVLLTPLAVETPGTKVRNLSTRVPVGTGDAIAIVGLVIEGSAPQRVLLRVVGPTLAQFGVASPLPDPQLWLFKGGDPSVGNQDWGSAATTPLLAETADRAGAFPLPDGSKDAALLLQLEPGVYTIHASDAAGGSGIALVEFYLLGG